MSVLGANVFSVLDDETEDLDAVAAKVAAAAKEKEAAAAGAAKASKETGEWRLPT